MTALFTEKEKAEMLHAAYVVEELAWVFDLMPIAPCPVAMAEMYYDVCPSGPPVPKPDWGETFRWGIEYAAGHSAHLHSQYGRESVVAEREYWATMEQEAAEADRIEALSR